MRNSSDESNGLNGLELYRADLVALLGATITVLLTLTGGPGAWGPLSTIIGLLLLVVLLAFFWLRRPSAEPGRSSVGLRRRWESFVVGFALSVVVGFVGAITCAQAIQSLWFRDIHPSVCRSVAVAQATTAARDLSDVHANNSILQERIDDTLTGGKQPVVGEPVIADTALQYAFNKEYDSVVGDCLAGETFKGLWWIGVPAFLLTLVWWHWNLIKRSISPNKGTV